MFFCRFQKCSSQDVSHLLKVQLKWKRHEQKRPDESEGTSQLNLSSLREAVRVYIRELRPQTPEDVNNLAALRAASYWCWDQPVKLMPYRHDEPLIKKATDFALTHWQNELESTEEELTERDASKQDQSDSSSDDSLEEAIIGN